MQISFRSFVAVAVVTVALVSQGCGDSTANKPVPTPEEANDIMKSSMKGKGTMTVPRPKATDKAK